MLYMVQIDAEDPETFQVLGQKRVFFWDEFEAEWQSYREGD